MYICITYIILLLHHFEKQYVLVMLCNEYSSKFWFFLKTPKKPYFAHFFCVFGILPKFRKSVLESENFISAQPQFTYLISILIA